MDRSLGARRPAARGLHWDEDDERDQRVVLPGVSWEHYLALSDARQEKAVPRLAYLDGELEVLMPGVRHELIKKFLARLVEMYAFVANVAIIAYGSVTRRNKRRRAGAEADESYLVGKQRRLIVYEVVQTHGGIDKLDVYRRLGVAEAWFWIGNEICVYCLVDGEYQHRRRSVAFPKLDLRELARIIASTDEADQDAAVRAFHRSLTRRKKRPR